MSLVMELAAKPGVFAAGEYSYRGDRFHCKGQLDDDQARMASIMCRTTTMSVNMQSDILESFCENCGVTNAVGWIVRGPNFTVCAYAHYFCFLDSNAGSIDEVMQFLRSHIEDPHAEMI